jgi:hypothetical protein
VRYLNRCRTRRTPIRTPTAAKVIRDSSRTPVRCPSALSVRADLTALVSYDKRMLAAAQETGLPTACPV